MLKDSYDAFHYVYIACGVVLIVASIYLFIGNAVNYWLLEKERREEEGKSKHEATIDLNETNADTSNASPNAPDGGRDQDTVI